MKTSEIKVELEFARNLYEKLGSKELEIWDGLKESSFGMKLYHTYLTGLYISVLFTFLGRNDTSVLSPLKQSLLTFLKAEGYSHIVNFGYYYKQNRKELSFQRKMGLLTGPDEKRLEVSVDEPFKDFIHPETRSKRIEDQFLKYRNSLVFNYLKEAASIEIRRIDAEKEKEWHSLGELETRDQVINSYRKLVQSGNMTLDNLVKVSDRITFMHLFESVRKPSLAVSNVVGTTILGGIGGASLTYIPTKEFGIPSIISAAIGGGYTFALAAIREHDLATTFHRMNTSGEYASVSPYATKEENSRISRTALYHYIQLNEYYSSSFNHHYRLREVSKKQDDSAVLASVRNEESRGRSFQLHF